MNRGTSLGEVRAFRALYQSHYGFVWSTVRRMGVRADAIDDAVQDAFLVAFRRWSDLPRERHRAWLYGIARRVSSNARRQERRRTRKHEALRVAAPARVEPDRQIEASAVLDGFVRRLDGRDRELFVLGAIEGLTGKELSAALQLAPSTLHDRLTTLRRRFRAELGAEASNTVEHARRSRPRASSSAWALLLPQLSVAAASPLLVLGGAALVAASLALTAIAATGSEPPESVPPAGAASEPSLAAISPELRVPASPRSSPAAQGNREPPPPVVIPAQRSRGARGGKPSRTAVAAVDDLSSEASLVTEIKRALESGNAQRARALAERHAVEHAGGALSDAVVALHVEALCQLGEREQARVEAQQHLRLRPTSPVSRRLSRGCVARPFEAPEAQP